MIEPTTLISTQDVLFTEANPQQRLAAWTLNGASWAPPMSMHEYIGREQTLFSTPLSSEGKGTKYWVLHLKDDPEAVVAGCETTFKKALVADNGKKRVVDAYSIASVFTDPKYRGCGLATYMLKRVQEEMDRETECGALYSDIGRVFYTRLGWVDFPTPQLTFALGEGYEPPPPPSMNGYKFLEESEVRELCERDVKATEQKFDKFAEEKSGKTHFTFLPDYTQCSWHFARDAYVGKVLNKRDVRNRGAVTADGASWIYWDHDLREKKLKIMRLVTRSEDSLEKRTSDVKQLLVSALAEAKDWNIPKVLVWCPDRSACVAATDIWLEGREKLKVVFDEREDGSIPSLRWKGGKSVGHMVWEENEYFSWC